MKNLKIQYSWTNELTNSIEAPHLIFLLKSIKECGSIRAAAFDSGFSYRHVWGEIKRWEDELGNELITWIKGQPATLTDFGEALLKNEALFIAKIAPQIDIVQSHCKLILAKTLNPKLQTLTLTSPHDLCFTELQKRIASDNFQISAQQASNQDSVIALNEGECLIAGIPCSRRIRRLQRIGYRS